jgi:hypothetical protein
VGGKRWIVDPYGDQGAYKGDFDEDKQLPHGLGKMDYTDGRIYSGEWSHGQWNGKGKAVFGNKDVFEGNYYQDQRHGYGVYNWHDGRQYAGEFCMDQRQGKGTYNWPDGANYKGEFQKGLRHGEGLYMFKDGSVYTGEWQRGKYHGVGEVRVVFALCPMFTPALCSRIVSFSFVGSVIGQTDGYTRESGYLERLMGMDSNFDLMGRFVMMGNGIMINR